MRLFSWFILRRLVTEPLRSATTAVGLALGVAVVVAIQLTNASSLRGFETALDSVSGRASLEVAGTSLGIDETALVTLGWLREYGEVAPIVEGEFVVREPGRPAETLRVLGVDVLRERAFRDYRLAGVGDESDERLLGRLLDPGAVILAARFAAPRGLAVDSTFEAIAGDRRVPLTVRGLLEDDGPARALDGRVALMDIAAAQRMLDRLGRIDRIEVRLHDPAAIDTAERTIAARLPPGVLVQRPSARGRQVEQMLAAFHLNLTALSYVALVVGLFLVYNTIAVAVLARRDEIGMLRAIGVTRGQVRRLFLGEAAVLAVVGCLGGIALGRLLADFAVSLTATTVSTLYVAAAAAPPALDWRVVALAFATGLPLSLVAAVVPAADAARVPPVAAIRGGAVDGAVESPRGRRLPILPLALLALGGWLATRGPVGGLPLFGYGAAFTIMGAAALLVPAVLACATWLIDWPVRRWCRVEDWLAVNNLATSIRRLSISVAALAVSLAMMTAIAVMIGSFRDTVVYWVGQTLQADLFVAPGSTRRPGVSATISSEVLDAIARSPDVAAADGYRMADVLIDGTRIRVGSADFAVVRRQGSLLFKAPADGRQALAAAAGAEVVVASEAFSLKHRANVGDTVMVPTAAGPRPFRLVAVYYDYSNDRGVLLMDRGVFARHFGEVGASGVTVYLREGVGAGEARDRLLSTIGDRHQVYITTNQALRAEVLRIFDSTFAITDALELVAILVAMLGVSGTLLTLILEREREITMLRLVGMTRAQIRRMVIGEAVLIGLVSQGLGVLVGLALSLILIYVVNVQSFGWTIQFAVPWRFLAQASALMVLAAGLAGVYPASRAVRLTMVPDE